jgi:pimeloyl-ACP methyl ester carboxylesterase
MQRFLITLLFTVLASPLCMAAEPWSTLPPTPTLPADTVGHRAEINGASIWHAEWGKPSRKLPVLLLHGGFANSDYFGHLVPALIQHGYRVIAMDSRGHGRSSRSAQHTTYHLMAEDVIALLNQLKVAKASIVGWSDGGVIGLDLEIHHPERVARLFAFGADADTSGLKEGFEKSLFGEYMARTKDEYARLAPDPADWSGFSADLERMWATEPAFTVAQLQSIHTPTTIADAQYDEAIKPEHWLYIAHTIPNARLVILPNLSHFAMLQDPRAFNSAVLEFLNQP